MAYDETSYSDWLANNPNVMQQPTLQQQPATTNYSAFLSTPNAPTQQPVATASGPQQTAYQKATPLVQAVTSGASRQDMPIQMGQSAQDSSGMTQSDAPNVHATPMKPRINKIMQIIGAIFSMGATAAASKASQAGQQQGGSNPPQGG